MNAQLHFHPILLEDDVEPAYIYTRMAYFNDYCASAPAKRQARNKRADITKHNRLL